VGENDPHANRGGRQHVRAATDQTSASDPKQTSARAP
jgi:hypothetical protein